MPHTTAPAGRRFGPIATPLRSAPTSPTAVRWRCSACPTIPAIKFNGGRPGAAEGPAALRAALADTAPPGMGAAAVAWPPGSRRRRRRAGAGHDEARSSRRTRASRRPCARCTSGVWCPLCIGGGHDLALPCDHRLSRAAGRAVGGINFDAHLDVRERVGSGMAFRRLIDGGHSWLRVRSRGRARTLRERRGGPRVAGGQGRDARFRRRASSARRCRCAGSSTWPSRSASGLSQHRPRRARCGACARCERAQSRWGCWPATRPTWPRRPAPPSRAPLRHHGALAAA